MNNENNMTIRTTWTMISVMIITLISGVNSEAHALPAPKVVYNNNILYINKYNNLVNIKDIINIDYNKKSSYNSVYLINDLSSGSKFLMPSYNKLIALGENPDERIILSRLANAIKSQETGGASAYYRHSYSSSACGAYQYMPSTWNNYMGYKNACEAPAWVQDQRIIGELKASFNKYHDWTKAVAAHLCPARAAHQRLWQLPLRGNPTVMQYVLAVFDKANIAI